MGPRGFPSFHREVAQDTTRQVWYQIYTVGIFEWGKPWPQNWSKFTKFYSVLGFILASKTHDGIE